METQWSLYESYFSYLTPKKQGCGFLVTEVQLTLIFQLIYTKILYPYISLSIPVYCFHLDLFFTEFTFNYPVV